MLGNPWSSFKSRTSRSFGLFNVPSTPAPRASDASGIPSLPLTPAPRTPDPSGIFNFPSLRILQTSRSSFKSCPLYLRPLSPQAAGPLPNSRAAAQTWTLSLSIQAEALNAWRRQCQKVEPRYRLVLTRLNRRGVHHRRHVTSPIYHDNTDSIGLQTLEFLCTGPQPHGSVEGWFGFFAFCGINKSHLLLPRGLGESLGEMYSVNGAPT